jgi:hypothetical protein
MAYVTGFDQDVFISYAQVDNEAMNYSGAKIRWVTDLKEQLQKRLDIKLGRIEAARIWMDLDDLGGNELVTPSIDTAVRKTAALVMVLSTGYLSSAWCQKEAQAFVKAAGAAGRLFVVHREKIALERRPEGVRDLIGFNFYDKEMNAELSPASDEYSSELVKLSGKLAEKLIEMKQTPVDLEVKGEAIAATEPAPRKPAVYLAEGSETLDDDRDSLGTYIEKLGYRVLPAKVYPRGAKEFTEKLDQDLAQAKLFVQLLGQYGTRRTEDLPEGYEGLQVNRARGAGVPALRAYQRETVDFKAIKDGSYRAFLQASDVMAQDLEEFKAAIKEELEKLALREAKPAAADTEDHPVLIHVLQDDLGAAYHISNRLAALNLPFEILDETEQPPEELAKVRDYSGFVLVYGEKSGGKWIKQKMRTFMDLRLAKQPAEPACVLYFEPPEKRMQMLASPPPFFRTIDSASPEPEFQKFLEELKARIEA